MPEKDKISRVGTKKTEVQVNAESAAPVVIKYPRTEHLFDSGGTATTSDDLVLKDLNAAYQTFCQHPSVVVEEKVDGANLGLRLDTSSSSSGGDILVQNRSRYISPGDHAQFSRVYEWVVQHRVALMEVLRSGNLILYGEWCTARHSIPYHRLPGYFVAFDIFDVEEDKFLSRRRFHGALKDSGIPVTPTIEAQKTFGVGSSAENNRATTPGKKKQQSKRIVQKQKRTTCASSKEKKEFVDQITALLETQSRFRNDGGTVEGIVLRLDDQDWLLHRYKVVRPDFIRGCNEGHWSRRQIEKQTVDYAFVQSYLDECYLFA